MNGKTNTEMRITDVEMAIIKSTFADNDELLKILRKVFLPAVTAKAPIGQTIDLWMTLKIDDMTPEQAITNIKARNLLITHVEQQLVQLKFLAGKKDETVEDTKNRLTKDSAK